MSGLLTSNLSNTRLIKNRSTKSKVLSDVLFRQRLLAISTRILAFYVGLHHRKASFLSLTVYAINQQCVAKQP